MVLDDKWDEGLNRGIAARPNKRPPAYYDESGMVVRVGKAIGLALAAIAPFYTVLDTLGALKGDVFVPCSNFTCHYLQLFQASDMPGSGVGMIAVRNGASEAIGFNIQATDPSVFFKAYACPRVSVNTTRSFKEKLYGQPCPHLDSREYRTFLASHPDTHELVTKENKRVARTPFFLRAAYAITKFPMWVYTYPLNVFSKYNYLWGMEHIPTGQCPHMSAEEMKAMCQQPDVRSHIHNHLKEYTPTKILAIVGLVGCAVFSAMHDIWLLLDKPEIVSLQLGAVAALMQGAAVAGVFLWSMGATGVFVSHIMSDTSEIDCVCYYQLPEITQLVALSTPFALLMAFYARVQLSGLASLFGDHLYFLRFDVPFYLAKQSTLWTWAVLMTPKAAGTVKAKPRWKQTDDLASNFGRLCHVQQALFHYRNLIMACVGLAAGPFMVSSKELLYSMLLPGNSLTPLMRKVVLYVALPLPAIITGFMGVYALWEVANVCVSHDEGEDFPHEVDTFLPGWIFDSKSAEKMRNRDPKNICGFIFFSVFSSMIIMLTAATMYGLTPDLALLLGHREPERASLVQAELWGSCGFVFMVLHVQRLFSGYVFSTWDDLESLVLETKKLRGKESESRQLLATEPSSESSA